MTHKILQGLSEALDHAKRDTTDPRALVDESNRHRPARELLQGHTIQDSLADALTSALDRAEKAEARGRISGRREAAQAISKRRDDYISEFGSYDPSTGETEYPGTGDESVEEWSELEEMILALIPTKP